MQRADLHVETGELIRLTLRVLATSAVVLAGVSGGVAGLISNPLDVVKTRLQTQDCAIRESLRKPQRPLASLFFSWCCGVEPPAAATVVVLAFQGRGARALLQQLPSWCFCVLHAVIVGDYPDDLARRRTAGVLAGSQQPRLPQHSCNSNMLGYVVTAAWDNE
ncbi:hypothetical protein cyc_01730 [Cyclospora cayetanensis]|uniref:Uncharacterized protein n=1 Tax=Cyclospora cayetanensis TaxID=88456 RepID=A0A1D3CS33_9EIME|nr:hypothetical protein cyc_01730 [Cyclospora cayetanensis]